MFHANDGVYFERLPDGSVAVEKHARAGRPTDPVSMRVVFTPDTWASVVAAVSAAGLGATIERAARAIHDFTEVDVEALFAEPELEADSASETTSAGDESGVEAAEVGAQRDRAGRDV